SEKHYCLVSKVSKEGFFASYLGPYLLPAGKQKRQNSLQGQENTNVEKNLGPIPMYIDPSKTILAPHSQANELGRHIQYDLIACDKLKTQETAMKKQIQTILPHFLKQEITRLNNKKHCCTFLQPVNQMIKILSCMSSSSLPKMLLISMQRCSAIIMKSGDSSGCNEKTNSNNFTSLLKKPN
ncbi:hypothetical protein pdam_00010297, partial [Pocillopora damicornis]